MEIVIFMVCYLLIGVGTLAFAGCVLKWKPHPVLQEDYLGMVLFWWAAWIIFFFGLANKAAMRFCKFVSGEKEDES
jgi:hypothetical protein